MRKKIIFVIVLCIFLFLAFYYLKPFKHNTATSTTTIILAIGGDKDSHGCLVGAGYSWCPSAKECQRLWEGTCIPDFIKTVNFVETKDEKVIFYEDPGKPAIASKYIFHGKCKVNNTYCNDLEIKSGTKADIKGITLDNEILITDIKF